MLNEFSQFATQMLLIYEGSTCTYTFQNGSKITTKLYQSPEASAQVIVGGELLEIRYTDFIGLASDFPTKPTRGERIENGDDAFEVRPIGDTPYKVTKGQIRIHTQKVAR